jgi:4-oxalocrotonate tautomerase
MPILHFHLVQGQHSPDRVESLLLRSSVLFAEVLRCPIDRVRVFVTEHAAQHVCIGGQMVNQAAPFFSFVVLQGRSLEDRQRLLAGFTDLIVEILGSPRDLVRGAVLPVAPEDWCIGGVPASQLRQAEIAARQLAATASTQHLTP